jgi:hypothetical protein
VLWNLAIVESSGTVNRLPKIIAEGAGLLDVHCLDVLNSFERLIAGAFEHDEANRLVDQLLSNGYLYECNGIRLTNGE